MIAIKGVPNEKSRSPDEGERDNGSDGYTRERHLFPSGTDFRRRIGAPHAVHTKLDAARVGRFLALRQRLQGLGTALAGRLARKTNRLISFMRIRIE